MKKLFLSLFFIFGAVQAVDHARLTCPAPDKFDRIMKRTGAPLPMLNEVIIEAWVDANGMVKFPLRGTIQFQAPKNIATVVQDVKQNATNNGPGTFDLGVMTCPYRFEGQPFELKTEGVTIYQCPEPQVLNNSVIASQKTASATVISEPYCTEPDTVANCDMYKVEMSVDKSELIPDSVNPGFYNLLENPLLYGDLFVGGRNVFADGTATAKVPMRYRLVNGDIYSHQVRGKIGPLDAESEDVQVGLVNVGGEMLIPHEDVRAFNQSTDPAKAALRSCGNMLIKDVPGEPSVMSCFYGRHPQPAQPTGVVLSTPLPPNFRSCVLYGAHPRLDGQTIGQLMGADNWANFEFYHARRRPSSYAPPAFIMCTP